MQIAPLEYICHNKTPWSFLKRFPTVERVVICYQNGWQSAIEKAVPSCPCAIQQVSMEDKEALKRMLKDNTNPETIFLCPFAWKYVLLE